MKVFVPLCLCASVPFPFGPLALCTFGPIFTAINCRHLYTHQQASLVRKEFWTILGQYLAPIPSSEGIKINWINYRTGVKHFHVKMDATDSRAFISLELDHKDPEMQRLYFEQLIAMEGIFMEIMQESWDWQLLHINEHDKPVSLIIKEFVGLKVLNKDNWPLIISFFKERILKLDQFWSIAKDQFLYT